MKPMPWRFLVLTDAGVDTERPVRVLAGGADAWLASLGASFEIPAGKGVGALRYALDGPAAFTPAAAAARLAARGDGTPAAAEVDAVLHHPALQHVESAWRGLGLLLEHAGEGVEVEVLSLPRKHLVARFREVVFEPELRAANPLSLVLADFDFSHRPAELADLNDLAGMAKVLQAPFVAHASAGFFELRYLVQAMSLPDPVAQLRDPAHTGWRTFQATEAARWAALTLNRYLQRAAYTIESGGHPEAVSEANPDSYLWGRGVWLVGAAVARSVRTHGHALDLSGPGGRFLKLPARPYPVTANETAPLATEVALAEMKTLEISRAAFTPVVGPIRSDTAILPMVVTVSRLSPGKLTVEGTLAYQLMAGRLAQLCGQLLDEMPAGGAGEAADFFRAELTGFLGKLAGEKPEEAVSVELREEKAGKESVPMAEVRIRPVVTLEGKQIDFAFMLPLVRT